MEEEVEEADEAVDRATTQNTTDTEALFRMVDLIPFCTLTTSHQIITKNPDTILLCTS